MTLSDREGGAGDSGGERRVLGLDALRECLLDCEGLVGGIDEY